MTVDQRCNPSSHYVLNLQKNIGVLRHGKPNLRLRVERVGIVPFQRIAHRQSLSGQFDVETLIGQKIHKTPRRRFLNVNTIDIRKI